MARMFVAAPAPEVALVSGTAKTVLQVGTPANLPVQVRLIRQSSSGTMTTLSVQKLDGSISETPQSVAQYNASAEPTTGDVIDAIEVHPQTGYEMIYPLMQEPIIEGGGRVGIECTSSSAVNVRPKIVLEE
jgi:hypothetical protein